MTTMPKRTTALRHGVIVAGTLPLWWWGLSLALGATGVAYNTIGDVVVTWNITTAVGLIVLIPAALFSIAGSVGLPTVIGFRRSRWHVTVGLTLTAAYCLLVVLDLALAVIGDPARRDPNSWSPELTTLEQWAVAGPYALFLVAAGAALTRLSRTPTGPTSRMPSHETAT